MSDPRPLLLLAGSFEARRLAEGLTAAGIAHIAVLSEPPRGPDALPQPPLLRRFDSAVALETWMGACGVRAVLDASHAFDRRVTGQAVAAAAALDLPYLRLERPPWPVTGPTCQAVASVAEARARIAPGARVFAATGWDSLSDFRPFPGARLLLRQTRRHDRPPPFEGVELIFGDPPFSVAAERRLFADLGVDTLICRNLGGRASRPKVDAAAVLGLTTLLIDRPAAPEGAPFVHDLDAALDWAVHL